MCSYSCLFSSFCLEIISNFFLEHQVPHFYHAPLKQTPAQYLKNRALTPAELSI